MLFRIQPAGPPQAYQTYGMAMPLATHWRPASCDEAGCEAHANGWVSTFDLTTELGKKQYHYCRQDRTRSYTLQRVSPTVVKFIYSPGNRCFREHQVPVGRPARFYVTGGDWRGNPNGYRRIHTRAEDWVEDFAENQDRLAEAIQRG